jgi:exosortase/archaeosortase family protein
LSTPTHPTTLDGHGGPTPRITSRVTDLATSPLARGALVVVAALVAYRYSLDTLLNTVGTDTPLAYLGLAPLIAFGVALLLAKPQLDRPEVSDRHIDYLIGLPLLATALLMTVALPGRMSILYWYYRVDLLSLPLFVAGAVALLFGASTLYRVRYAIGFLLLAWPAPYNWALDHGMGSFANLTLGALHELVRYIHVATVQPGGDGSVFIISHSASTFTLSVASACTGVDSFVGFLLVGLAVMTVVEGNKMGRLLWIASGMALSFVLNLVRLIVIFWSGGVMGEKVALDGLHPVLGLILFCIGVAVMVTGMGLYGLEVRTSPQRISAERPDGPRTWRIATPLRLAGASLAAVTLLVGVADSGFSSYSPVAGDLGAPRLVSFTDSPITPPGWTVSPIDHYPWATQYFGSDAVWTRFEYSPLENGGGPEIYADVINTSDLQSFSNYDVIACYDYHGYGLSDVARVNIGAGVDATELTFTISSLEGTYNAVYWVWPVQAASGVRYERVVLLAPVDYGYGTRSAGGSSRIIDQPGAQAASRTFLANFAKSVVAARTNPAATAVAAGS